MRQCDKEHIIRREATIETKKSDALDIIRFAHEDGVSDDKTRMRIASLGLASDIIDSLFAQIEEEEKALVN